MKSIQLETERLLLRPFKEGDEAGVFEFASNIEVQKFTGNPVIKNIDQAKSLIKNVWLKDYATYGYGRLAVIHKKDQKIIGFNGIKFLPELNKPDLGYRFLPQYWGKGIATESSKAILNYVFKNVDLEEILGFVMPENIASAKVLEKLHFSQIALKPYPQETKDIFWYALTKQAHEKQQ